MALSPVLFVHICAAILGLLSGFAALFFRKGSRLHRMSGNVFFVSMLSMSTSATYLALGKSQVTNALVGTLTFYMAATAWLTVKRKERHTDLSDSGLTLIALVVGVAALVFGWKTANSAAGLDNDGIPAVAYFVLASIALLAAGLDVRMFSRGGLTATNRIARHLWRMCFALLITTVSFFNGERSKVLPDVIRETPLHDIPVIVVAISLVFWLMHVLFTSRYRGQRTIRRTSIKSTGPSG
ncbi:MAG TPA: hypothetical protein VNZ02_05435 [Steroidobacteraceae bacterium]|nr:hypothetical protein [Steroidobacteraceae bacterium]